MIWLDDTMRRYDCDIYFGTLGEVCWLVSFIHSHLLCAQAKEVNRLRALIAQDEKAHAAKGATASQGVFSCRLTHNRQTNQRFDRPTEVTKQATD